MQPLFVTGNGRFRYYDVSVNPYENTLAERMGWTAHISSLRLKLHRLWMRDSGDTEVLEDWLVDVANSRGARIVARNPEAVRAAVLPSESEMSNAELAVGLLLPQNLDRPQILRLAAQLVSGGKVAFDELKSLAVQERVERMLAELSRQALRVEPKHAVWLKITGAFGNGGAISPPLLHYTRLAEPVPVNGRVNAQCWRLVA